MAGNRRKFTDQEKIQYLKTFRALQESENITVNEFAARVGLKKYTFTNWLYRRKAPIPSSLIKIENPVLPAGIPCSEIRIEYYHAIITTDLNTLASVLRMIKNA